MKIKFLSVPLGYRDTFVVGNIYEARRVKFDDGSTDIFVKSTRLKSTYSLQYIADSINSPLSKIALIIEDEVEFQDSWIV